MVSFHSTAFEFKASVRSHKGTNHTALQRSKSNATYGFELKRSTELIKGFTQMNTEKTFFDIAADSRSNSLRTHVINIHCKWSK